MKTFLVIANFLFCTVINAQVTPKGSSVSSSSPTEGFSSAQIAFINNQTDINYPLATRLGSASTTYNCHGYAFNMTEGGSPVVIDNPSVYIADNSYYEIGDSTYIKCHSKIIYHDASNNNFPIHSAVATTTPGVYISKWGTLPLMQHSAYYAPVEYLDQTVQKYYNQKYAIVGPSATLCTTSGTYEINTTLSPNATISWSTYPTSAIVSPNSPSSPSTTLTKIADGFTNLLATITYGCSSTPISFDSSNIYLMAGFPYFSQLSTGPYGADTVWPYSYNNFTISLPTDYPSATYSWSVPTSLGWSIISGGATDNVYAQSGATGSNGVVEVYITACGVTRDTYKYVVVDPGGDWIPDFTGGGDENYLKISPNPANNFAQISFEKKNQQNLKTILPSILEVRVSDKLGSLKKQLRFAKGQHSQLITLDGLPADLYTVSVYDGKKWYTAQLLIGK